MDWHLVQDSTEAAARQSFPLLGMDRNGEQWSSCRCIQWIRLLATSPLLIMQKNREMAKDGAGF